jgi:hypothetical protein
MAEHAFTVTAGRIAIEKNGRDVSGLHLGRREFQVGRGAYVSMGTIGGVSISRASANARCEAEPRLLPLFTKA